MIRNIIKSHYFSICISFIFLMVNIIEFNMIYRKIDDNLISNTKIEEKFLESDENTVIDSINETIYVDIKGEVKNPGVYEIDKLSRVSDLISLSGGLTKNANTRFINLSKHLNDGDVIVIYSNSEIKNATKVKEKTIYIDTPCVCEEVKSDACLVENLNLEDPVIKNETKEESVVSSDKININTASEEELSILTGIGSSKAKAIIEYRNTNGLFKSIEEIVNVKGISETMYAKIKENITI